MLSSLPTLRRKIFSSFSLVVGLYAILGLLLVVSVNLASKTTPKLLHVNYDSISAASKMSEAITALEFPAYAQDQKPAEWVRQFDQAIEFESTNITEVGELEIYQKLKKLWDEVKTTLPNIQKRSFQEINVELKKLVYVNEKGMFGLARDNERLSREVMLGALFYFVISLILCLFFADNLSQRLSLPLKSIAEALQGRGGFSRKLKLPEPTNLEILILTNELQLLWQRLSDVEKVNVAELIQQKSKLETLLESVDDGLLVLNDEGVVLHCNSFLMSIIGVTHEKIEGQKWTDLSVSNENYLSLRNMLGESLTENQQIELQWKHAHSFFEVRSRVIETKSTKKAGVLYLLHDITEKKQREKFRSEFIDLLSHELKTPLQSLGTASELLTQHKMQFSDDLKLLVETIAEDIERMKAVAGEFVQVTQSHSKILKLKLEPFFLSQHLPDWIKPFTVIARDRNVTIEFLNESKDAVWANLDEVKFPWVISNILSNAVRFSPDGGVVQVSLLKDGDWIEIKIKDAGPGIPENEQNRMFEPFYQSPMKTASGMRGLFGIGLTIAKEVVEAHDGRIEYLRLQPQGSEFKIRLPVSPAISGGQS